MSLRKMSVALFCVAAALASWTRPAAADYLEPTLKQTSFSVDYKSDKLAERLVIAERKTGPGGQLDTLNVKLQPTFPLLFTPGSAIAYEATATITFYSAKGGTLTATLNSPVPGNLFPPWTPDEHEYAHRAEDKIKLRTRPGETVTKTLKIALQGAPHKRWVPATGQSDLSWSIVAGKWDDVWPAPPANRLHLEDLSVSRASNRVSTSYEIEFECRTDSSGIDRQRDVSYGLSLGGGTRRIIAEYRGDSKYVDHAALPPPPPVTPPPPPKPPVAAVSEDYLRLLKLYKQVQGMEKQMQLVAAALHLESRAVADLRTRIALLESAIKDERLDPDAREAVAQKLPGMRQQLETLLKAQDNLIRQMAAAYKNLALQAGQAVANAADPAIRAKLKACRDLLAQQADLAPLQLYLAADRRDEFAQAARGLIGRGVQPAAVYRLNAVDYLTHGDPRSALYALRKSLQSDPTDASANVMLREVEAGYLRAIAAKTLNDAADLHARLDEALMAHGQPGWLNAVKDTLTTGLGTSLRALAGHYTGLSNQAGDAMDRAAGENLGIQIIIRLRQGGMNLDDIGGVTLEKLTSFFAKGGASALSPEQAAGMQAAVALAVQNPDVQRVMRPSREQFDTDRGKSYFNSDAFDVTWKDYLGDAINVANIATFAPGVALGKAARLAPSAAELTETSTVAEAMMSGMRLADLAAMAERSAIGKAVLKDLTRFGENGGIVSKMLAQTLLDQGALEAGKALGGQAGEIAAQALMTLGGTDLETATRMLRKRGVNAEAVEKLYEMARSRRTELKSIGVDAEPYLDKLEQAVTEMKAGRLSAATSDELKKLSDELGRKINTTVTAARAHSTPDTLVSQELNKQEVLRDAMTLPAAGKRDAAEAATQYVRTAQKEEEQGFEEVEKTVETTLKFERKLKETAPAPAGITEKAEAPGTTLKPSQLHPSAPPAPTPARISAATQSADTAFLANDLGTAKLHYTARLESGSLPPQTEQYVRQRLETIGEMEDLGREQAVRRAVAPPNGINSRACTEFNAETQKYMETVHFDKMRPLAPDGRVSAMEPRVICDEHGMPLAVFKPAVVTKADGTVMRTNIEAELMAFELGRALGMDVPAVTRVTVPTKGGTVDGIAVRYVQGADFMRASEAQWVSAKADVARDKVLSLMLGDMDRHQGNLFRTADGRVFSMDHGLGDLTEEMARESGESGPRLRTFVERAMETRLKRPATASDAICRVEEFIVYEDMADIVRKLQPKKPGGPGISDEQLRGMLEKVYRGVPDAPEKVAQALETLNLRREALGAVLERHFKPLPASVALERPPPVR